MKIRAIYTFGSPRVLSPEAADYAETSLLPNQIFRHVRYGDAICDVPFKQLPEPTGRPLEVYDHAGLIAVLDEPGEIAFGPRPWQRAKAALRDSRAEPGSPTAVEAHYMSRYNALVYEQFRRNPLPRSNGWNPAVALSCARAARLVYKGPVREVFSLLGFRKARLVPGSGVEALLALPRQTETTPYGIVAFRTTWPDDLKEPGQWQEAIVRWQSHSDAERERWHFATPGSAHAGWLREVVEIEPTLDDALRRFLPGLPIVVTGHSKGAAQGLLWALRSIAGDNAAKRVSRKPRPNARAAGPAGTAGARDLPWTPSADEDWRRSLSYARVGTRIRALRESRGLTQAELALATDSDKSHISRIEKGDHRLHLDTLLGILAELDVSVAEFFDEPTPESITPIELKMVEEVMELSPAERRTVFSLVRFKLGKDGH